MPCGGARGSGTLLFPGGVTDSTAAVPPGRCTQIARVSALAAALQEERDMHQAQASAAERLAADEVSSPSPSPFPLPPCATSLHLNTTPGMRHFHTSLSRHIAVISAR